jgi:hypothetical protein
LLPKVSATSVPSSVAVYAYHIDPLFEHAVGSSAAAVAPEMSTVSLYGSDATTDALSKSSLAPAARATPGRNTATASATDATVRAINRRFIKCLLARERDRPERPAQL